MSADIVNDITRSQRIRKLPLIVQLPIAEPKSVRAAIGNPALSTSWTTQNWDNRTAGNEPKWKADDFSQNGLAGNLRRIHAAILVGREGNVNRTSATRQRVA